jgi:hypothetical protein
MGSLIAIDSFGLVCGEIEAYSPYFVLLPFLRSGECARQMGRIPISFSKRVAQLTHGSRSTFMPLSLHCR